MKSSYSIVLWASVIFGMLLMSDKVMAVDHSSADGKYHTLVQKLHCPSDKHQYGKYKDYGYWGGGSWCGQQAQAGYWVWVYPFWYVWKDQAIPAAASAHGKYANLRQTLTCARDRRKYGKYSDYGYWGGGAWCGQQGKPGFWVWVAPTWYVWDTKR